MGSSVVVGVFVIMLTTAMISQLPSTSHCLMNKSSGSSSSSSTASSNRCINGSTHQYCQQLIIPQDDQEEDVDGLELALELEPMNMIMKHKPVDNSHQETSSRMLSSNGGYVTQYTGQRDTAVRLCGRRGYGQCTPLARPDSHGSQCKSAYARGCYKNDYSFKFLS